MSTDHVVYAQKGGTAITLRRGERQCLIGFNLDAAQLSNEFVGFALEYKEPGDQRWKRVYNRLQFSYDGLSDAQKMQGAPSTVAPFQKYRWVHFPFNPVDGEYRYRVTPMYMRSGGTLHRGTSAEAVIKLGHATFAGVLDIGFTRGFASSQAYTNVARFPCQATILPPIGSAAPADLDHDMSRCETEYSWLGFESRAAIYALLDEALSDATIEVDALCYELREPAIVDRMEALGNRLRVVIDNHGETDEPTSNESVAAARFATAGAQVKRGRFARQQHNKVMVLRRAGVPFKALGGSTNFSLRGLYVQNNNTLIFTNAEATALFGRVFDKYFAIIDKRAAAGAFRADALSQSWHDCSAAVGPTVSIAVSPHKDAELSLEPIAAAIEQAESSVLYAMVFLNQLTGRVREALEGLLDRTTFSYGVSQRRGGLAVQKPDGSRGLVSFAYLAANAPQPFAAEWSSNAGGNSVSNVLHHKFVVTDFNLPTAKVFTGSSNLAKGGEEDNGDHIVCIESPLVATAYAIEALRIFDHYHFRLAMSQGDRSGQELRLAKPPTGNERTWFKNYYIPGHIKLRDRLLFGGG